MGLGPAAARVVFQTLNRKFITSPSLTMYSLPSARILPASLAPCSPYSSDLPIERLTTAKAHRG